ncbi:MAG: hypothetical protein M1823_005331 [Watsoniomyces obsoletus]|nr:MAG: hypothetical protein M1823_005331 [Watsoniomyces obsoletus]
MRWCWDILNLSLLVVHAWAAFVPINLHQHHSRLHARDVPDPAELLRPTHDAELLYAADELEGPPSLVTLSVKHDTYPYVVLERFEDLLSSITCAPDSGNGSTTISMTFADRQHFVLAEEQWSGKAGLTFITHHHSCNEDVEQREVYRASYVRFDHNSTTATITSDRKEFGYSDTTAGFRLQGATAPGHVARRIRRRDLSPPMSSDDGAFGIPYYRRWKDEELLFSIPGQVEVYCLKCWSDGEVRVGFDFDIQSMEPGRLATAAMDVAQGRTPKPFYDKAIMTYELVRPFEMMANLRTHVHGGLSVRWPGLVSATSGKKVLGDKMMKEGEKRFITVGPFQFFRWYGFGLMFIGAAGGSGEIDMVSHQQMPNGLVARVDFLTPSNSYFSPDFQRNIKTRVNKLDGYASADLAYGFNGDITVKVKIPKGDWRSLRTILDGGSRGKIGYKDDVLKWYVGGYLDLIGAGVEIATPSGLDANCEPSDELSAVRLSAEVGCGLAPYMQWVVEKRGWLIPRLDTYPYSSDPRWYKKWPGPQYCQVVGGRGPKPPPIIPDPVDLKISDTKKVNPWWFPQLPKHGGTKMQDPDKLIEQDPIPPQPPLLPGQQPRDQPGMQSWPPGKQRQQEHLPSSGKRVKTRPPGFFDFFLPPPQAPPGDRMNVVPASPPSPATPPSPQTPPSPPSAASPKSPPLNPHEQPFTDDY